MKELSVKWNKSKLLLLLLLQKFVPAKLLEDKKLNKEKELDKLFFATKQVKHQSEKKRRQKIPKKSFPKASELPKFPRSKKQLKK